MEIIGNRFCKRELLASGLQINLHTFGFLFFLKDGT